MKKPDQNELRIEIGKLSFGNLGLHIIGIFEMFWLGNSIVNDDYVGIGLSVIFGLYFAYKLAERQNIKKHLISLVELDEE